MMSPSNSMATKQSAKRSQRSFILEDVLATFAQWDFGCVDVDLGNLIIINLLVIFYY